MNSNPTHSKQEVLQQIRQGNRQVLAAIYREHGVAFVQWLVVKYGASEAEAMDVYQETMAVFWQNVMNRKLVELTSSLKTYLFGIGKNIYHAKRRKATTHEISLSLAEDQVQDEVILTADLQLSDRQRILKSFVGKLGKVCQRILTLYYLQETPTKDIIKILKYKSLDVLYTQKKRCMQQLRKMVKVRFKRDDL